jgi:hypothetical protein
VQRSRDTDFSCYNVTHLPESLWFILFAAVVPLKEGLGLLLFVFGFCFGFFLKGIWLDSFALGFLVWEAFGREKNY